MTDRQPSLSHGLPGPGPTALSTVADKLLYSAVSSGGPGRVALVKADKLYALAVRLLDIDEMLGEAVMWLPTLWAHYIADPDIDIAPSEAEVIEEQLRKAVALVSRPDGVGESGS